MANSWNGPQLGSPIRTDVPELQKKLIALLKGDPTSVANIPSGAKRLVNTSGTKWQVQQYNGSSWAAIGKLMHDVDKLDGYHAAITPAASTVAVRNADKKLEGDITGNAATASSAATLSETLPVNKGGTGATASAQARKNLGVPPTSHASTNTTHGVGNSTQYGHLKLSDATDSLSDATGGIAATPAAVKAAKGAADAAQNSADAAMTKASTLATSSTPGIVKPGTGMSVDSAGSLGVDATVVRTSGSQNIEGAKKFIDLRLYSKSLSVGTLPTSTLGSYINIYDNNGVRYSGLGGIVNSNGVVITSLFAKPNDPDSLNFEYIRLIVEADGTSYASAPTPKANSNTNHIATTEWVRNYTLPTGALIPSLATSMTGYLLCNGAAVSRTTYANLFSIIGTKFGAGDGSTTFNLPDFRNRVFWGASGNLMSVIEAGLPDHTHNFYSPTGDKDFNGGYNTNTWWGNNDYRKVVTRGVNETTIYGKSTTVQPPAIAVNIFIKY